MCQADPAVDRLSLSLSSLAVSLSLSVSSSEDRLGVGDVVEESRHFEDASFLTRLRILASRVLIECPCDLLSHSFCCSFSARKDL